MNWRTRMLASVAASCVAVGVAVGAEPAPRKSEAKPAATETADKTGEKSRKKAQKCAPAAGSRIRRDAAEGCEHGAPGTRVYTADEIATTGEMNISEALRKLDPRFQ